MTNIQTITLRVDRAKVFDVISLMAQTSEPLGQRLVALMLAEPGYLERVGLAVYGIEVIEADDAEADDAGARIAELEALVIATGKAMEDQAAPDAALAGIAETVEECGCEGSGTSGWWRYCSGCYDTEDGHPTRKYGFSRALGIEVGCGCHECGGLGAVWEYWTDEQLAEMGRDAVATPAGGAEPDTGGAGI